MNSNTDDIVYEQIKQKILDGEYAPAQRLIETSLAQQLDVGRHRVRSALERLQIEDLVHIEPNRGASVTSLDLPEVLDILEAREVLERGVTTIAAQKMTADQTSDLENCLHTMRRALQEHDYDLYSAQNRIFHQIIYDASGNKTMPQLIKSLRQRMVRLQYRTILIPGREEQSIGEHTAIFQAIQAQDPQAAGRAAEAHMSNLRTAIQSAWKLIWI